MVLRKDDHESLPADLRQIIDRDAASEAMAINQQTIDINERRRKAWVDGSREWSPQAARLGGRKDAGRHLRSSSASCPCVLRAPRTAGSGFGSLHLA